MLGQRGDFTLAIVELLEDPFPIRHLGKAFGSVCPRFPGRNFSEAGRALQPIKAKKSLIKM